MIELQGASVFYGSAQVLSSVSLRAASGEVAALIGRNGAGKTTTLRTLAGWLPCRSGTLMVNGNLVMQAGPEVLSRLGVALVPDDRQIFPTLSVEENLRMALVAHRSARWRVEDVYGLFPQLRERCKSSGAALSGGEQQMLAIARALLCQPRVLLLDEPTEGLAPLLIETVVDAIRMIAGEGLAIVLVEQNARIPSLLAKHFFVLDSGRVAWSGDRTSFEREQATVNALLSV